jgi:hypothetical protein
MYSPKYAEKSVVQKDLCILATYLSFLVVFYLGYQLALLDCDFIFVAHSSGIALLDCQFI